MNGKSSNNNIKNMKKRKLKLLNNQIDQNSSNSKNDLDQSSLKSKLEYPSLPKLENMDDIETVSNTLGFEAETNYLFESLRGSISEGTMNALEEMNFKTMTEIQAKCIPKLLEGRDLRGTAKTGSGKTLAFLIPVVEHIVRLKYEPIHGTGVIIVSPTRELSMQTFGVLKDLMKHHTQSYGLIMGGTNRKSEADRLSSGINIIIATPGRLLDHLQNTRFFKYKNLTCFVIDEADRICDVGFEEDLQQIIKILPRKRQTMLFSATNNKKTDNIANLALKSQLLEVDVDKDKEHATTDGLEQMYVICPTEKRFLLLYTFIKKNKNKKGMIFFSSCMEVKYFHELLNFVDTPVQCIHGRQKQTKRTAAFYEFSNATTGILLCTDVAARGWDIPTVDWIVQYDPPDDPKEYIHRVGRTARAGKRGSAILFLTKNEVGFIQFLNNLKVKIEPMDITWSKVANIQLQLEKLVSTNYYLQASAKQAYSGYLRAYNAHKLKEIFDVHSLDLNEVARCFGFVIPPHVNIGVASMKTVKNTKKKRESFKDKSLKRLKKC